MDFFDVTSEQIKERSKAIREDAMKNLAGDARAEKLRVASDLHEIATDMERLVGGS